MTVVAEAEGARLKAVRDAGRTQAVSLIILES